MHKHDGLTLRIGVRDAAALAVGREQSPEGDCLVIRQGINAIPRDESEVSHDRTITRGWCRRAARPSRQSGRGRPRRSAAGSPVSPDNVDMAVGERFRRLDDRVLGPPPPGRHRGLPSPTSLGWGLIGAIGSAVTRTRWGLVVFICVGVVGMFAAGLLRARRGIASAVVTAEAELTADKQDPVRDWLARRNQRVRSVLVFAARFPFIASPAVGAAVGFGISNETSCVTLRNSGRCAFYVPGHHTVLGGVGWGLLIGLIVYVGALLIREALTRAAEAQDAVTSATSEPTEPRPATARVAMEQQPEFVLVRPRDRRHDTATGG